MGFSAEWLGLREPADHAARDATLLRQAARVAGPDPVIVDLGSGTGSTMRAFAECAPRHTAWHLVDNEAELLAKARNRRASGVQTHLHDLTKLDGLPLENATLVTASALLDLCGADWLRALAARIVGHRLPFYAALSYDGLMDWSEADVADANIVAAFNQHQRTNKGFGPALGPDAPEAARHVFSELGYVVIEADSPWQLGPGEHLLQAEFLSGVASAVAEIGEKGTQDWLLRRQAQIPRVTLQVGHRDFLAIPPELVAVAQARVGKEIGNAGS